MYKMLIPLEQLIQKYSIRFQGVLHIGAHECEEIHSYEPYLKRDKILWIEAIPEKVEQNRITYPHVLIEQAVVSDVIETVTFHVSNNGQSSSMLELGTHKKHHPHIHYTQSFTAQTQRLNDLIQSPKYSNIPFNFLNLDIQGAELKALKGMEEYLSQDKVEYIYTEVNREHLYEGCCLVEELDEYLGRFGFQRIETCWTECQWGDAFYIKR